MMPAPVWSRRRFTSSGLIVNVFVMSSPRLLRRVCLLCVLGDLALVLAVRIVLWLALVDMGGPSRPRLALLFLVLLGLRLEDEGLARGQGGGVVRLRGQRRLVDRWHGLGLLELLVQASLALGLCGGGRLGHEAADQADGANRIVIGRDDPVDEVRIAVGIGHCD